MYSTSFLGCKYTSTKIDQFPIKTMNLLMQRLQQTRFMKVGQDDWFSRIYGPLLPLSDCNRPIEISCMPLATKQPNKKINAMQ